MSFGENLRKYRHDKGITQEELAAALSIAPQTVSKWERGDSYPDFTLLPPLASFFDVSLDDLVGIAEYRSDEKRDEMLRAGKYYTMQDNYPEAISVLREALLLFPGNEDITYWLAVSLRNAARSATLPEDEANAYYKEAEPLYEKLTVSSQPLLRSLSQTSLMHLYKRDGRLDEAIKIIDQLPLISEGREIVLASIVDDDSRQELEDLYWTLYWELGKALTLGANRAEKNGNLERAMYLWHKRLALSEWLFDDERDADARFVSQWSTFASIAEIHAKRGEREAALDWLSRSAKSVTTVPYNGVWMSGIESEAEREERKEAIIKSYTDETPRSFGSVTIMAHSMMVRGFNCGYSNIDHPIDNLLMSMSNSAWNDIRDDARFIELKDELEAVRKVEN